MTFDELKTLLPVLPVYSRSHDLAMQLMELALDSELRRVQSVYDRQKTEAAAKAQADAK